MNPMRSDAQKKADKKYKESGKDKYSNLSTKIHIDNLNAIKKIALSNGLTPSKYTTRAIFYCINNKIDLSKYDEPLCKPDDTSEK